MMQELNYIRCGDYYQKGSGRRRSYPTGVREPVFIYPFLGKQAQDRL